MKNTNTIVNQKISTKSIVQNSIAQKAILQNSTQYYLLIVQANQQKRIPINKSTLIQTSANSKYYVVDENGNLVEGVRFERMGERMQVHLPSETAPQMALEPNQSYAQMPTENAISGITSVPSASTVPNAVSGAVLAAKTFSPVWLAGIGALSAGALFINKQLQQHKTSGNSDAQEINSTTTHNTDTNNNHASDATANNANAQTGNLQNPSSQDNGSQDNSNQNTANQNSSSQNVGNQSTNTSNPNTQNNNPTQNNNANNANTKPNNAQSEKPIITLEKITGDNIISKNESNTPAITITGDIKNAQDGDSVHLKIGDIDTKVVVQDGKFSLVLDGKTLAVHKSIHAQIVRNGEIIEQIVHNYEVQKDDTQIIFAPIAGDNIINLQESTQNISVSGKAIGAQDGDNVVISCHCPSCTGVQWVDITTQVKDGNFSVDVAGDILAKANIIKATLGDTSATQTYEVDIAPPKPSLVYDAIGNDGVINQSHSAITLRGRVINLGEHETVAVKVRVGAHEYTPQLQAGYYQVDIPATHFAPATQTANSTQVVWELTAQDKAGNLSITPQIQHYIYDVDIATPSFAIDKPKVVNAKSDALYLTGTLSLATEIVSAKVVVDIDGTPYDAKVSDSGDTWSLVVPISRIGRQGDLAIHATLSVQDTAGNHKSVQAQTSVLVDTVAPTLQINLDEIAQVSDAPSNQDKVTIKGMVAGDILPTDQVQISVAGKNFNADIDKTGAFSVQIERALLLQNANKSVVATITSQDSAGNISTKSASVRYEVGSQEFALHKIANDDIISAIEAKQDSVLITGTAGASTETVWVQVGEHRHDAIVQDGIFSVAVPTYELINNPSAKVSAYMGDKVSTRTYHVNELAAAQIYISDIDTVVPSNAVSLTGKVDLTQGLLGKYQNKSLVRSIQVRIGDKEYMAGLDDSQHFSLSFSKKEWQSMAGQEIHFSLPKNAYSIYNLQRGQYDDSPMRLSSEYAQLEDQRYFHLDNTNLVQDGRVVAVQDEMSHVRGVVHGTAQIGDTVVVKVGDSEYSTKVVQSNGELVFGADVASQALAQASNVQATLYANNAQKAVSLNYSLIPNANLDGTFKVEHPLAGAINIAHDERAPYFIRALTFYLQEGHLRKQEVGQRETAQLTYRFNKTIGSEESFDQINREATRKAIKMIESYANINFTEVGEDDPANIGYAMSHNTSPRQNGFASYGGSVWLSASHYQSGGKDLTGRLGYMTVVHETMHSLGAKHPFEGPDSAVLPKQEDDKTVSFMNYSYRYFDNKAEITPYDMAYLHYRYGVNPKARTQDDTYYFKPYNLHTVDGDVYIWDGGGVDTFDATDQTQGVHVNLTPGSWIYSGKKSERFLIQDVQHFDKNTFFAADRYRDLSKVNLGEKIVTHTKGQAFIGYGTQIERLLGSKHDDTLTGNNINNAIYGNAGDDTIDGGAGDDYIDGGKGIDSMAGGTGDDIFIVDDVKDSILEHNDGGNDSVYSYVDYVLPEFVESINLVGVAKNATGNSDNNALVGNALANYLDGGAGDDIINGGGGSDVLVGGAGNDTFVFSDLLEGTVDTILDFNVREDKIALLGHMFASLDDVKAHVHYDNTTGYLTYDKDGASVHFATLQAGLDSSLIVYQII